MCGIAGIVGRLHESNRRALERMSGALRHRGPDGEGQWTSAPDESGCGVMLAHRRLAIIDLSSAAAQPMVGASGAQALVFNGEIYNYRALAEEIPATVPGSKRGDTAVLFDALHAQGTAAIPRLRGMFALAHWDTATRRLLLARDPLGIKPLYIARNPDPHGDWSLAFASELRSLLASGLLGTPRLDPAAVASVVWNGFVVGPNTAVTNVELLGAGEYLSVDTARRTEERQRFWSLSGHDGDASFNEEQLAHALRESVRLHLESDVPLGVFLSSGVDSSAVANLARQVSDAPIHTFTLALEEREHDEGRYARRIAEAVGSQHHETLLTEQRFVAQLESALDSLDQPTFDGLNSYFMSRAVNEAGLKVALVGTGGDELFGGYRSFLDLPRLMQASRTARHWPHWLREAVLSSFSVLMCQRGGVFPPQTRWAKLRHMVARGDDIVALYQMAYALFLPSAQRQLLGSQVGEALIEGLPARAHERLHQEVGQRSPLSALSVLEQRLFLGERLLRDTDSVSMGMSIETRLPLVDATLLTQVDRLPNALRYDPVTRKALLRRVGLDGLDPALFNRPKSGFVLPYGRWLRNHLGHQVDQTLRDAEAVRRVGLDPEAVARLWSAFTSGAPGLYWSRVWALYVFVRWCHRHQVFI